MQSHSMVKASIDGVISSRRRRRSPMARVAAAVLLAAVSFYSCWLDGCAHSSRRLEASGFCLEWEVNCQPWAVSHGRTMKLFLLYSSWKNSSDIYTTVFWPTVGMSSSSAFCVIYFAYSSSSPNKPFRFSRGRSFVDIVCAQPSSSRSLHFRRVGTRKPNNIVIFFFFKK